MKAKELKTSKKLLKKMGKAKDSPLKVKIEKDIDSDRKTPAIKGKSGE